MLAISGNGNKFTIGAPVTDPHFANVVLLSSFDGADGDTAAVDDGPLGLSLSAVGSCELSDAEPVFGATSLGVNAANESDGYMTISDSSAFNFGTGDFTIEGWARAAYWNGNFWLSILGNFQSGVAGSWSVFVGASLKRMRFIVYGAPFVESWTSWDALEHHFVISRNGSVLRIFKDGVLDGKHTGYGAVSVGNIANDLIIGGNNAGANDRWRGYTDEIRITDGVGRYNSDASFTVPTEPYPKA